MKRLSFPAAFGVVLALLFAGLGSAPAFAGPNPVPIYLKADPCPGASLCGNFLTGQFKGSGKRTGQFNALPGLTVTRASFAYGENADGSLRGFQAGQARWTSKGLGVFEATTNNALWSEDLTNAAWTKALTTVTAGAYTAPNATATGQKLAETATTGLHQVFPATGYTVTASTVGTYTVFLAPAERTTARVVNADAGATNGALADINLQSCSVIGSPTTLGAGSNVAASAQLMVNGWCRVRLSAQASTSTTVFVAVRITQSAGVDSYAGTAGSGIYVWGQDFRSNAAYPVPYCPTTSSTATCAADQISFAANIPQTGAFVATYLQPALPGAVSARAYLMTVNDSGFARLNIRANDVSGTVPVCVVGDGVSAPSINSPALLPAGATVRVGCSWTATTAAFTSGGVPPNTSGVGLAASLTGAQTLNIAGASGSATINTYISGFALYSTAPSSAQLQAATAGTDQSSLSLNFASGLYKTTTPYVRTNWVLWSDNLQGGAWTSVSGGTATGATAATLTSTVGSRLEQFVSSSVGQAWTYSALLAGSGVVQLSLVDGGGAFGSTSTTVTLTATPTRYYVQRTMNDAGSTGVYARVQNSSGSPVTLTTWSQNMLEKGTTYPSSAIQTTTTAASVATTQSTNPADVGNLTFTSGGGYATDCNGALVSFAANNPRITCAGVLIEEARTNLLKWSMDLTNVVYSKTNLSVAAAAATAPDGTSTGQAVARTSTAASAYSSQTVTGPTAGQVVLFQRYVKPKSIGGYYGLRIQGTYPDRIDGLFNINTCTVFGTSSSGNYSGASGGARSLANGWCFIWITGTSAVSAPTQIIDGPSDGDNGVAGWEGPDRTLADAYVWNGDINTGASFPTSPILTTSGTATRAADVMSYGGLSIPTTMTFAASASGMYWNGILPRLVQFADGSSNLFDLAINPSTNKANVNGVGLTSSDIGTATVAQGGYLSAAVNLSAGAVRGASLGSTATAVTGTSTIGTMTQLYLGQVLSQNRPLNGNLQQVRVYPYAANDNELTYRSAGNF
jgi:hypothetical protein